jgi:hypothetical protein
MLQNQHLRLKLRYHLNQCHQMSGVTKRRKLLSSAPPPEVTLHIRNCHMY